MTTFVMSALKLTLTLLTACPSSSADLDSSIVLTSGFDPVTSTHWFAAMTGVHTVFVDKFMSGLVTPKDGAAMSSLSLHKSAGLSLLCGDDFKSVSGFVSSCSCESTSAMFACSLWQSLFVSSILSAICKHAFISYVMRLKGYIYAWSMYTVKL